MYATPGLLVSSVFVDRRRSPGERTLGLGFACDGPEGRPRRGGRERDNRVAEEDGPVQHQLRD